MVWRASFLVFFFVWTVVEGITPGDTPIIVQEEILVAGRKSLLLCEVLTDKTPANGHFPLSWTNGHMHLHPTGETNGTWHSFVGGAADVLTRYTSEYEFTVSSINQGENFTCTADFGNGSRNSTSLTLHVYNSTLCDKQPCKDGGFCDTRPESPNQYTCTYPNPHPETNPCNNRNACDRHANCTFDPDEVTEFSCGFTELHFQVLIGR